MPGPWEKYAAPQAAPQATQATTTPMAGPWAKYAQPQVAPQEQPQGQDQNFVLDLVDSLSQGFTGSFGDELTGHEAALLGRTPEGDFFNYDVPYQERYQRAVDAERSQQEQFREDAPVASFAAEVAGGIANPAARLGAPVKGASLLANTLRAGKTGAGYGAVYGAGAAEGGVQDRAGGATVGAAVGGLTGALATPIIAGGAKGINILVNQTIRRLPKQQATPAARKAAEALIRDGISPEEAAIKLTQMGPDAAVMDLGANTRKLAGAVSRIPGEANKKLDDFVTQRQEGIRSATGELTGGQYGRISGTLDEIAPDNYRGTVDSLVKARSREAKPLYEKAFSKKGVYNDRIKQFVESPIGKKGLREGLEIQEIDALAAGEKFNPTDAAIVAFNEAGDPIIDGVPNMKTLDAIKKGLDKFIDAETDATTGKLTSRGRSIVDLKRSFLDEIDFFNPDYKVARKAFEGKSKLIGAAENGRRFMSRQAFSSADDLSASLRDMGPDELEYFKIGAAQEIRNKIGNLTTRADLTKRIMGIPELERKVKLVFGGEGEFKKYIDRLTDEQQMFTTYAEIKGGSPTAQRLAAQEDLAGGAGELLEAGANAIVDPFSISGLIRGAGALGKRAAGNVELSEGQRSRLADILMSQDPKLIKRQVRAIGRGQARRGRLSDALAKGAVISGSIE